MSYELLSDCRIPTSHFETLTFAPSIRNPKSAIRNRKPLSSDICLLTSDICFHLIINLRTSSGCRAMTLMVFFFLPVLTRTFTIANCGALL